MAKSRKKKKNTRKTRAIHEDTQDAQFKSAPHSFVFHRGKVGINVRTLVENLKKVMEPYTASRLQVKKSNVLKDFTSVAGALNVSHFMILSKSEKHIQLRIARIPRGPTLTFQIPEYCLSKDVLSSQKKPDVAGSLFSHHPLLVLNGFSTEEKNMHLMLTMFQNMFPSISVNKVNLNNIKRCLLISYNPDTKLIDFRHYKISLSPVGLSRGVKKLTKTHIPDLGKYSDISEYIERGGNLSESEAEMDGPHNEVTLPQKMQGRGNLKAGQSAIRLKEIGPRLTLQLVKIEEGLCAGPVIHHSFIHKTPADIQAHKEKKAEKLKVKQQRQAKQQANIKKKEAEKAKLKEKSLAGMKRKEEEMGDTGVATDSESDDDIAHYRREVGVNPDAELFPITGKKRKQTEGSSVPAKKVRQGNKRDDSKSRPKKVAPPGFRKKDQVAKQKKKKMLEKQGGKSVKNRSQNPKTGHGGSKPKKFGDKSKKFDDKSKKFGDKSKKFGDKSKKFGDKPKKKGFKPGRKK